MNLRLLQIGLLSLLHTSLNAQSPDPLFASQELFEISLSGPFSEIDRQRDKELSYDGKLSYTDDRGNIVELDATFEVRGNWRLQRANCGHAQLWVDLKRGQTAGTVFENQNRLKLVVQCGERERQQQWLVKEKLAYDLFSAFSDLHFDTRLVNARYVDSAQDDSERTHLAFFIEHQNRIADRFNLEKVEENSASLTSIDAAQANLVALFMYMIGNTDFSLTQGPPDDECCHNSKLLRIADGVHYPFPYDFDSSGFVDAAYASPPAESLRLRSNKQRLYRGYCSHEAALPEAIASALATKLAVEKLISDSSFMTERTLSSAQKYISEFYEIIGDERKVQREIFDDCR